MCCWHFSLSIFCICLIVDSKSITQEIIPEGCHGLQEISRQWLGWVCCAAAISHGQLLPLIMFWQQHWMWCPQCNHTEPFLHGLQLGHFMHAFVSHLSATAYKKHLDKVVIEIGMHCKQHKIDKVECMLAVLFVIIFMCLSKPGSNLLEKNRMSVAAVYQFNQLFKHLLSCDMWMRAIPCTTEYGTYCNSKKLSNMKEIS